MNEKQAILPSLILALQRRRIPATATFISVLLGALLYLLFTPRQYEGIARLILDEHQTSLSEIGQNLTQTSQYKPGQSSPVADRAELIKSTNILQNALNMVFDSKIVSEEQPQPSLKKLRHNLQVKLVPATNIIELNYKSEDPELTAEMVNAIAQSTVETSKEDIRAKARSLREFLEIEVAQQQSKVAKAEVNENQYRETNRLVSLDNQTTNLVNSINTLENQEHNLQAQVSQKATEVQQLQATINIDQPQNAYLGGRIGQDQELEQLREKLEEIESELARSSSYLTEQNPILIGLKEERAEIAQLYQQKLRRVSKNGDFNPNNVASDELSQDLVSRLVIAKTDLSSLQEKLRTVQQERTKLEKRLTNLPKQIQPLTELVRGSEEANESLKFLQRKLEEARIAEQQLFSDLKVVELAEVQTSPSFPNPPLVMATALVAGSLLSLGLVLALEALDNTVYDITELEATLQLPILGAPPQLPEQALLLGQSSSFLDDPSLVEPYHMFLRNLDFRTKGRVKLMVVSSTIPGEGKSVVASHLAAVSAAVLSRRTLIIDADLMRPRQHQFFKTDYQSGLANVIERELTLNEAIQSTTTRNLDLLTCGKSHHLPSSILESIEMKNLLHQVSKQYDLVIVDTPPISFCADAQTLSKQSDGLVMVTRPNYTPKDVLTRTVAELKRNGVSIFGFVMNGNTSQTNRYYNYGYDSYYAKSLRPALPSAKNNGHQSNFR